ncbi:hypothetical protein TNIN_169591 [Trichonephila inaurata madagascariensis]|uniref:Uncharacterized protein n=1 Tax=Trichonephila inaurata madagascariensis TaxID=2747483 RepID=A0A8X6WS65_9ARAC|nr:hypothetical protein TNIN_169591 [Trichonephila inaurata madagascariensis]
MWVKGNGFDSAVEPLLSRRFSGTPDRLFAVGGVPRDSWQAPRPIGREMEIAGQRNDVIFGTRHGADGGGLKCSQERVCEGFI